MKRVKTLLILIIVALITLGAYFYYDAFYVAPTRLKIRHETIINPKIPESFNNTQILLFSDIYYNSFMDADRLDKIINSINKLEPDIVIFLGDLFDKPLTNSPTATTQTELANLLQKIEAPLGKFAIYGDQDLQSVITKQIFDSIMNEADFEVLSDQHIKLTRQNQASISLIALNNIVNTDVNYEQAFQDTSQSNYNLVVSHTPDIVDEIVSYNADLLISGHSLGKQFNLPLLNTLTKMEGAQKYYHGKTKVAQTLLDISNGLGTTGYDARLFSDPEIVIYLFKQQ